MKSTSFLTGIFEKNVVEKLLPTITDENALGKPPESLLVLFIPHQVSTYLYQKVELP